MRRRPYSGSHISTAKQCIPKRSAVSNTRAWVLQNWQDSLTYVVWFRNGRAVNLRNLPAWRKMMWWSFFPNFGGLPAPKGLAISRIFIHRSVQLKTLIQLKKFDVSSRCVREISVSKYGGQCSKNSQNGRTFAPFSETAPRKSQLKPLRRSVLELSVITFPIGYH